ncbi:MAG: CPXCG motif-containing cysteine-rich protein [Steroidobacteraceae bacterium]
MARRSPSKLEEVVRAATHIAPENVDRLYGLEPVFEPDGAHGVMALPFVELQCPSCGETIGTTVDVSAGSRCYIEDCEVCCRPMEIHIECGENGGLGSAWAQRSD